MAFDYAPITAKAKELIESFGKQVGLIYIEPIQGSELDSNKPWLGTSDSTGRHDFKGPLFDVEQSTINGTTIKKGDKQVYISAESLPVVVTEEGHVEDSGVVYEIVPPLETIAPAGTPILYIANLRK